jgi:hypothetical protein
MTPRLKKGDITIPEVLRLSRYVYKSGEIDNKLLREKVDVLGGKIIARRGLTYNQSTKKWEQVSREVRFDFIIKSNPVSYPKQDTVPIHKYPVTFLFKDFSMGFNSPFRWRTGGLKRWRNPTGKVREATSESAKELIREKNLQILNQNIKNGLQGNFIFNLMWVLYHYGLLFGPLTCKNKPPKKTNPAYTPYFDKTALFLVLRVFPRLFRDARVNQTFGKISRENLSKGRRK